MVRNLLLALALLSGMTVWAQTPKTIDFNQVALSGDGIYSEHFPLDGDAATSVTLSGIVTKSGTVLSEQDVPVKTAIGYRRKQPFLIVSFPAYVMKEGRRDYLAQATIELQKEQGGVNLVPAAPVQRPTDVSNSVLANGNWYKIAVPKRGIYKIDYAFLQSLGVNPATINPARIRLYGNGGTVLPERVTDDVIDDLEQNSIFVSSGGSTFGAGDYILFYANGPVKWEWSEGAQRFKHTQNYYEDNSFYFLNFDIGNGERIASAAASGTGTETFLSFDDYAVIDADTFNPGTVGKQWWGYKLQTAGAGSASANIPVNMGQLDGGDVLVEYHAGGIVNAGSTYRIGINNQTVANIAISPLTGSLNMFAPEGDETVNLSSGTMNVSLTFQAGSFGAVYLDYLRFNARRALTMSGAGGQLSFRDVSSGSMADGETASFQIAGATSATRVWEVTDPLHPVLLNGVLTGSNYKVTRPGDEVREFIAFDGTQYLTPVSAGTVNNQNLHAMPQADLIIITNNDLLPAAQELAAFHQQYDDMTVNIATVDKIYNEFSSGGQDIAAIRNFIRMFYNRASGEADMPKNVLLLGAASYDYKNRIANNTNIVPVYQTYLSTVNDKAFSSDDLYGLMEAGEGLDVANSLFDLGVGRIPAFDLDEAMAAVNKIKTYTSGTSFGPWKNVFTLTSDNSDGAGNFSENSEELGDLLNLANTGFNLIKLYGDVIPTQATPSGPKMVTQSKMLSDQMYLGNFLVNYIGHGGPIRLAAEDLVYVDVINSWKNMDKLPVFITGTCDFGRFDDPSYRSGGASIAMKSDGGSIASITTTQLVYNNYNNQLITGYIENQFNKNSSGKWNTLGEAMMHGKNVATTTLDQFVNTQKFALLGDPALTLAMPVHNVRTDSLTLLAGGNADTINALGRYKLSGSVTDANSNVLNEFNGKVYITIYDKAQNIPMDITPYEYKSQSNVVYKGLATVSAGVFSTSFVVPQDINFDFGKGKISYYAENGVVDAAGFDTNYVVGGFSANAPADNAGPVVQPFMDNEKFRDGGVTGPDPLLYVKLYDDNGINVTGSSVGHDLIAVLDEDLAHPYVLNNYYQAEANDFTHGTVSFPLANIPEGMHVLRVKAWDTYNNSGEGSIRFVVKNKDVGMIGEVYNYPNPFSNQTTFVIQHNLSKQDLEITIRIYNSAGSLVKTLVRNIYAEGNNTEIPWDGEGDNGYGLGTGLYFYKVQIKNAEGIKALAQQKLSLLR